jgi:hypothetical protein
MTTKGKKSKFYFQLQDGSFEKDSFVVLSQ